MMKLLARGSERGPCVGYISDASTGVLDSFLRKESPMNRAGLQDRLAETEPSQGWKPEFLSTWLYMRDTLEQHAKTS